MRQVRPPCSSERLEIRSKVSHVVYRFLRALTKVVLDSRSGRDAFGIPSVQQNGRKPHEGHLHIGPRERDAVRARRTIWPSRLPTAALRRAPSIGSRAGGRSVDRHCSFLTSSEGSLRGLRVPFGTGQAERADLEEGSV